MPPNRKTPDLSEPEKPPLERARLNLEELGQIVAIASEPRGRKRAAADPLKNISPEKLRREAFFQSPVDKSAWIIPRSKQSKDENSLVFNASGVLCGDDPSAEALERSAEALRTWLRLKTSDDERTLVNWVTNGKPTKGAIFDEIEKELKEAAAKPELLYNQPICRLVREDQLRYDPDYQALYQITPAQEQLTKMKSKEFRQSHDRIKRTQRVYWGISETFQSLVALFDSDLGRGDDAPKNKKAKETTKELISIAVKEKAKRLSKALSPAGLNRYSPLRFWSPPPSFASSVFHMLFWRSIITGKDLFGRKVEGESVQKRAESYYVSVNYFNPAKFRIADYASLFKAILTIAGELEKQGGLPLSKEDLSWPKEDLPLPENGPTRLFYPNNFADVKPRFQEFEELTLSIPFSKYPKPAVWDLAKAYELSEQPDLINGLLRFLRDRAIELILWSTYQMEIRSIGLIPIQYLYQINLTDDVERFFEEMSDLYGDSPNQVKRENFSEIIQRVSEMLLEPNFNSQIKLEKVYGGPHRDVFQTELFDKENKESKKSKKRKERKKIKWLEK